MFFASKTTTTHPEKLAFLAKRFALFGAVVLLAMLSRPCTAQLMAQNRSTLALRTLGGRIEWTDQLIWFGWRIQRNAQDGHCRLLDDRERRHAAGSFEYCLQQLVSQSVPSTRRSRHVVILLHGLAGNRHYMGSMERQLTECGFDVVSFGYASTKQSIQELACSLESVVRNLPDADQVSFVAHSMGNIVVRNFLYRVQHCPNPPDVQFCRMVMISPPNQGAYLADTLGQRSLIQRVFGPAVDQFAHVGGWPALEQELATPWFEFGIIAGGVGNDHGYLARVPGDDDGLLSIDSHNLDGASDFIQVGGLHPLMPKYQSVQSATVHFLRYGHFPR